MLETYLAPLECLYIIIKVKVTFDSNALPLLFPPRELQSETLFS